MADKVVSAAEAVARIGDGAVVTVSSSSAPGCPDKVPAALGAARARPIVARHQMGGETCLYFPNIVPNVCILRATTADQRGNLTDEHEGATLGGLDQAIAVRNHGALVIVQVKRITATGSLRPHEVRVPGHLVDLIVLDPDRKQTSETLCDPAISGEIMRPWDSFHLAGHSVEKVIARRAAMELRAGQTANPGFGISTLVPRVVRPGKFTRMVAQVNHHARRILHLEGRGGDAGQALCAASGAARDRPVRTAPRHHCHRGRAGGADLARPVAGPPGGGPGGHLGFSPRVAGSGAGAGRGDGYRAARHGGGCAGYRGSGDLASAADTVLAIIAENPAKVDGSKLSLLDQGFEQGLRAFLPEGGAALYRRRFQPWRADDRRWPPLLHALPGDFCHCAQVVRLADQARLLRDSDLAVARMTTLLRRHGIG